MARNGGKARGAQPRQSGGGGGKRWPFFVGGLLLGLLLAFGVYLLKILPTAMELKERAKEKEVACAEAAETAKEKSAAKAAGKNGDKPASDKPVTFEFYTMLPKQEVVAPVSGNKTTVATPPPAPIPAPTGSGTTTAAAKPAASSPAANAGRYLLQAGSFRTRAEADQRRAQLLLSGQSVNVQDVKIAGGETWYRVMVGPFADEAAMKKARQQLTSMKVESLPVRQK